MGRICSKDLLKPLSFLLGLVVTRLVLRRCLLEDGILGAGSKRRCIKIFSKVGFGSAWVQPRPRASALSLHQVLHLGVVHQVLAHESA